VSCGLHGCPGVGQVEDTTGRRRVTRSGGESYSPAGRSGKRVGASGRPSSSRAVLWRTAISLLASVDTRVPGAGMQDHAHRPGCPSNPLAGRRGRSSRRASSWVPQRRRRGGVLDAPDAMSGSVWKMTVGVGQSGRRSPGWPNTTVGRARRRGNGLNLPHPVRGGWGARNGRRGGGDLPNSPSAHLVGLILGTPLPPASHLTPPLASAPPFPAALAMLSGRPRRRAPFRDLRSSCKGSIPFFPESALSSHLIPLRPPPPGPWGGPSVTGPAAQVDGRGCGVQKTQNPRVVKGP
jgi:hypothetical protein